MTKGEEQVAEARAIATELAEGLGPSDAALSERFGTLVTALDEISGHVFVKGAIAVPFTAAVRRVARAARDAYGDGDAAAAARQVDQFEAAVVKLQQKTSGTGGVAIT